MVPYAPGGSTDTVGRITSDRLSEIWGQQVVIENKPGTNIGAAAVASSDPDVPCDQPPSLSLAELPTVADAGVRDFDVTGWFAFFVPARTAPAIVEKIHIDTVTALSDATVKSKLENIGMMAVGSTPKELGVLLKAETEKWKSVIKEADIALDR